MSRYREIDLSKLTTVSIDQRTSKVRVEDFGRPTVIPNAREWLASLPRILAAENLQKLVVALRQARRTKKAIVFMLGGHVMKTGVSPYLIELMRLGYITHFASNGSFSIHDVETALFGRTSENVDDTLERGVFGMVRETADFMFAAFRSAEDDSEGMGECLGRCLLNSDAPEKQHSILAQAYELRIPFTVHVSIGGDILHQHAQADGRILGELSLRDFRIFASALGQLHEGGVVVNLGSAVVMPETFLKALTIARNVRSGPLSNFTTANLDMMQHYRPSENVLRRPTQSSGTALPITGHHEILVPLLYSLLCSTDEKV